MEIIKVERPQLVVSTHPLLISESREFHYAPFLKGETILEYLNRYGVTKKLANLPVIMTLNGKRLPRSLWGKTRIKPGTLIQIYPRLGEEGEKNTGAIVAMIALTLVTAGYGSVLGPVWSAAIMIVGGMVINKLFPPPKPNIPQIPRASPSYNIDGGTNRMRRFEPMPVICGRFRVFPDYGALPYNEFYGYDQYGNYIFEFGYNDIVLSEQKVGTNLLSVYQEVTYEESSVVDGKLALFPGNVDSQAGANLPIGGGFIQRTTSPNTTQIQVEIAGNIRGARDDGAFVVPAAIVEVQYRPVGGSTWLKTDLPNENDAPLSLTYIRFYDPITGVIIATVPSPIPFNYAHTQGIRIGELPIKGQTKLINGSFQEMRKTLSFTVPEGQYDVQVRRVDSNEKRDFVNATIFTAFQSGELVWTQLRSVQPDLLQYAGRKRVALRIRATGQINGTVDIFNAIAYAKTWIWSGTNWVYQTTSNPAWWYLAIARGRFLPSYITLDGTSGCSVSTPDSTALDIAGDLDLAVRAQLTTWVPGSIQSLGGKWNTGQKSYRLKINTDGTISLEWSTDGTAVTTKTSTAATGFVAGYIGWVRATLDVNDGSGNNVVTFYTSFDGQTWTQLGATVTTAGVTSIFLGSAIFELGSVIGGTVERLTGSIYEARIKSGIDGIIKAWFDASDTVGVIVRFWTGLTGEIWTANGTSVLNKGRRAWGAGASINRIDVEGIKLFGAWCDANTPPLTFNGVFDSQQSVFDMLQAVALAGRGTPSWATGKVGVVWDADNLPVSAVFGMANILPGSFEIEYATEDLADVIEGEFINPDRDWQTDLVRSVVPGAINQANVRRVQLFGCIDITLAAQNTNLYAASNAYRNRRYKWRTDFDGMPVSRGDVIELSHDLASLDYSGRLAEGGSTTSIKLPRKVPEYLSGSFIVIVKPDGTFATYAINAGGGVTDTLVPTSALPFDPWADPDHPPYDYRWHYGATATPGKKVKIDRINPISTRIIEMGAVDEIPQYYASKDSSYTYTPPSTVFGGTPQISNLLMEAVGKLSGTAYDVEVIVTWDVTGDYQFADVWVTVGFAPRFLITTANGQRSASFIITDNQDVTVDVTVYSSLGRAYGSSRDTLQENIWWSASNPPSDVTGFTLNGSVFIWDKTPDIDVVGYKIRYQFGDSTDWTSAIPLHDGLVTETLWEAPILPTGHGEVTFLIKAMDAAGIESVDPASTIRDYPELLIDNIVLTDDRRAAGWPGTIINGEIDGFNHVLAVSATLIWNADSGVPMWDIDGSVLMWDVVTYPEMTYEDSFVVPAEFAGCRLLLDFSGFGSPFTVEYRVNTDEPMWLDIEDADLMWLDSPGQVVPAFLPWCPGFVWGPGDAASIPAFQPHLLGLGFALMFGPLSDYLPWIGPIVTEATCYDFRITTGQGNVQGEIDTFSIILDVEDIQESIPDFVVPVEGIRVPTGLDFRNIVVVSLTLHHDGISTAVSSKWLDKDVDLGPLIRCYDTSNNPTAGTVDVILQGY